MTDAPDHDESHEPPATTPAPPSEPTPAETAPSAGEATAVTERVDSGKRAVALIIDAVITLVVGFVPIAGGIAATAYWLLRDGLDVEFMDHRSIGKKIMNLRPVTLDGRPVDLVTSVKRNWMFALAGVAQFFALTIVGVVIAIPLVILAMLIGVAEIVLVLTDPEGRRLGDRFAETRVIETPPGR